MKTLWLGMILFFGVSGVLGALGQLEYTETAVETPGTPVDELTPMLRTYTLPSAPLEILSAGPFELEISSQDVPALTLEAHGGLLYQTAVSFRDGALEILLEPGLTGPLEKGRLKVRVSVGELTRISLRRGTVGTLGIRQSGPLMLELRDQVFLKGRVEVPSLKGLISWKGEVRLSGKASNQAWSVLGLSTLRLPDMEWNTLDLRADEGGRIFLGGAGRISGVLRNRSLLEAPAGADTSDLQLREGSQVKLIPSVVPPSLP